MVRRFLFVLGSTRHGGNSEALARRAAASLDGAVEQEWLRLADHPLPPFVDVRHSGAYPPPAGNAQLLCDATLAATDLVLVTPVYWYSVSWLAKLYLDHWTAWMRVPALDFSARLAGRSLWGVLADADDDGEDAAAPVVDVLRRTAAYMGMRWHGALIGHANRPGEIERDAAAMAAASRYFSAGEISSPDS